MKNQMNKICCILMTLVTLALTVCPAMAAEETMQGVFGDDLTWRYTPSDHTLTVTGRGEMPSCLLWEFDYYGTGTPWWARGIAKEIERVVIRRGVTAIGAAAFQYCTALREVQLPNTLRTIGGCAFEHTALTEIRIPKNVEEIGCMAFAYCEELCDVEFTGKRVIEIEAYAFEETPFILNTPFDADGMLIRNGHLLRADTDLQGVCTIPQGVTDIASNAFVVCHPECSPESSAKITKAVFPRSLQYIGSYAFDGCSELSQVDFASENIRFGWCPFYNTALSEDEIEQYSMEWIDEPADAPAPTEYRIGAKDKTYAMHSYETIPDISYMYYDRLENYVVDILNPYYKAVDGVLYSKDGRVLLRYPAGRTEDTFTVPRGVKVIGAFAFRQCDVKDPVGLRKVVLPEGVTVIREGAFDGCCNLEEIVLPSTLKTIDACAFCENSSLESIDLPDGLREIGECFLNESAVTHVRFPDSMECFRGGSFCGSKLQSVEGYDRIPYKSEYGMEQGSFAGTPYQAALHDEDEQYMPQAETTAAPEETQEPEEAEEPEVTETPEPEHRNTLCVFNEQNKQTTEEYIKVGFFGRYRKQQVQLHIEYDLQEDAHIEWYSYNPKVSVDDNGLVTNRLHRRDRACILVSAVDGEGNILVEKTVWLYFYRFDFQLRHML